MPFPAGVLTRNVTLPVVIGVDGGPASGTLTLIPSVPMKWAATNQVVMAGPIHTNLVGGTATVELPIVQSGFVLSNNVRIDVWTYRAILSIPGDEQVPDLTFVLSAGTGAYLLDFLAPPVIPDTVLTLTEYVATGIPPGGTTGQFPVKLSDADLDVGWTDPPAGGSGSGGTVYYGADVDAVRPNTNSPVIWIGNTGVTPNAAQENDAILTAAPAAGNTPPTATLSLNATGLTVTATWTTFDADSDPVTAVSINWGDGQTTNSPTSGVQHTYSAAADYTVALTITDGSVNVIDTEQITVTGGGSSLLTEFSTDTIGNPPANWTLERWNSASTVVWSVQDDGGSDKYLSTTKTDALGLRALSTWDSVDAAVLATTNVEVVYKFRAPTSPAARIVVLASGSDGDEHGIMCFYNGANADKRIQISAFTDGVASIVGTTDAGPQFESNVWFICRLRIFNNIISVRMWKATDAEPTVWLSSWTLPVANRVAGRVGINNFTQNAQADFDWIGVATGGLTAPKGA